MHRTLAIAAAVGTLLASARADVIEIPASKDNTLFNDLTGGTSNGLGAEMIVGRAGGMASFPIRRALIAFDVASYVPAGATINSAQLVLVRTIGNSVARTIEMHGVLADWGEGASNASSGQGAASQPGDATWIHCFYPATTWSSPGGDFTSSISASQIVNGPGTFTWGPSTALTGDVQAALDTPSASFGWLLKDQNETQGQTTHVFGTRDNLDPALRPLLVIDFTPAQSTFAYCVAKTNGLGCTPAIGWSGSPSASATNGFDVTLTNALSQKAALLTYSTLGANVAPLHGGTLCIQTPLRRSPALFTGGNAAALDCSGATAFDFNARIASGVDPALASGVRVWCQISSRDPLDPTGISLSDALRFEIGP
jgi:hypothetical protein